MAFTKFKLLSYEVGELTSRADTLLEETKADLARLFALSDPTASLTKSEKDNVKLMSGNQGMVFRVFVLIPCEDAARVSKALAQIWNPDLESTKGIDVFLDPQ